MLTFAYDGSLNGDWVAHYAVRFAATTPERRLRLLHVYDGRATADLSQRIARLAPALRAADGGIAFFLYLRAGGWTWASELGPDDALHRSATGLTLVSVIFTQVANLVGRRYQTRSGLDRGLLRNPLLLIGVALELAFAVAVLYWPPLSRLLGTAPVPAGWFALAAAGAPLFFLADVGWKRLLGGGERGGESPYRAHDTASAGRVLGEAGCAASRKGIATCSR